MTDLRYESSGSVLCRFTLHQQHRASTICRDKVNYCKYYLGSHNDIILIDVFVIKTAYCIISTWFRYRGPIIFPSLFHIGLRPIKHN